MHASKNAALVSAILADPETAPMDPGLRATLRFLEKLTLDPDALGPEDLAPLRAEGVSDTAIEEAIYVAFLFNLMGRLADTLDFAIPTAAETQATVQILTRIGYGMGSIPG